MPPGPSLPPSSRWRRRLPAHALPTSALVCRTKLYLRVGRNVLDDGARGDWVIVRYWSCVTDGWHYNIQLKANDLTKHVTIRGESHSVPLAIHRSLAHCGYHCGQIIMIARILAGDDWKTITIPRGGSAAYNDKVWGKGHYQ